MANHVEHSLAVKLVLTDGITEHAIDSGLRLTHTDLTRIGFFNRLKSDLRKLVEAYKAEVEV